MRQHAIARTAQAVRANTTPLIKVLALRVVRPGYGRFRARAGRHQPRIIKGFTVLRSFGWHRDDDGGLLRAAVLRGVRVDHRTRVLAAMVGHHSAGGLPSRQADARCVLVSAASTRMDSACRHDEAPARGLPSRRSRRHEAPTGRASLHLLHRCMPEADSRCVLVSAAASTRMDSACRHDQAPAR